MKRHVYIISDLHLGGSGPAKGAGIEDRGFRLNTHPNELAAFIECLAERPKSSLAVELVINGDFIDFLAERQPMPPWWIPFNGEPVAACKTLDAIASRERVVFSSLCKFLKAGHRLTILLGNHDIELAMPSVRRTLESLLGLCGTDDYKFISNGEAYPIGDALIEHGNRYDSFNMVDHDALRRICSLQSRQLQVPDRYAFNPPPGSKLVSSVMNPIKSEYHFVDLLKPETEAVVPLLLALEPGYCRTLGKVAKFALEAEQHRLESAALPRIGGDINAVGGAISDFGSDMAAGSIDQRAETRTLTEDGALMQILQRTMPSETLRFLSQVTGGVTAGMGIGQEISATDVVDRGVGLIKLLLGGQQQKLDERLPALLKAVRVLREDASFDLGVETARRYLDAAHELGARGFRFIIFGHTHLAKRVDMANGAYLNSGTWADLMQFPTEILHGPDDVALSALSAFARDLAGGKLSSWVRYAPTYVLLRVDSNDKVATAETCSYTGPQSVR